MPLYNIRSKLKYIFLYKSRWFMSKLFNCGSMDKPENTINHGWWSISFYITFIYRFLSLFSFFFWVLFLFNCPLYNLTVISQLFYGIACCILRITNATTVISLPDNFYFFYIANTQHELKCEKKVKSSGLHKI